MRPTSHPLCKVSQASVKGHDSKQPDGENDLILTGRGSTHVSQGTWKSSKWPHTHCVRLHKCQSTQEAWKSSNDIVRCAMLHKHQSRDAKIQQLTSYSLCDSITAWNNSTKSSQGMRPNRKSMQPTSYSLREAAYAAVKGRIGVPVLRTEALRSAGTVCGVMGVRCNSLFSLLSITFWNTNQPLNDTRLACRPQTDALKMFQPVGVCRQSGNDCGCERSRCECVHHFAKTLCQTPIITLTPHDSSAIFAECFQESEMCTYLVDTRWNNNRVGDPKHSAVFTKSVWNLKHPRHSLSVQGRTPINFATYKHWALCGI